MEYQLETSAPSSRPSSPKSVDRPPSDPQRIRAARWKAGMILAVCAAPVIASYLTYYVFPPAGRTNYGVLIDPQRPVRQLSGRSDDGQAVSFADFSGRWLMVMVETGVCNAACRERLYATRQVRLTTGKDRDRVERLLLLTGADGPPASLLAEHPGLIVVHVSADELQRLFGDAAATANDHVYMVDPLGHLMMRFPVDVDPNRMKKDLAKLLRASRIG